MGWGAATGRIKLIHPAKISKYDPGLPAVP